MAHQVSSRVAVVTGGSGGMGRALRLARDGFSVMINFGCNSAKADQAVADIHSIRGAAVAAKGDVAAQPADIASVVAFPGRSGRALDQRPGHSRQRWTSVID